MRALPHAAVAAAHHLLPTELLTVPVSRGNLPVERAFLTVNGGEAAVRTPLYACRGLGHRRLPQ